MKKLFKFWLGNNMSDAHFTRAVDADALREYIKKEHGDVGYGYQCLGY